MAEPRSRERTILLSGRQVAYTVRRSSRAQRVALRVTPAQGLEVVVPTRSRLPDIPALLRERADWIGRALDKVAAAHSTTLVSLHEGSLIPYRGTDYHLSVKAGGSRQTSIARDETTRMITVTTAGEAPALAPLLERWYREEARTRIVARAEHYAHDLGVTYTRLTIRDGRSRWGSCSSRGGLNFSWRLILAPPEVLDYVVIHELAHRRELNHSPRFWAIVAALCPEHRLHQRWLRDHGARLMSFLRPAAN